MSPIATDGTVLVIPGCRKNAFGEPNPPAPFPRTTAASPPASCPIPSSRSLFPSPLRSAAAILSTLRPATVLIDVTAENPPAPSPSETETPFVLPVATSGLPSLLKSATTTACGRLTAILPATVRLGFEQAAGGCG